MGLTPTPMIPQSQPPWFLRGPHRQTLSGHFLPGPGAPEPQKRHYVKLADGDVLVFHENLPAGWKSGDPLLVLVHGLTGSHRSGTILRLARQGLDRKLGVLRMDLRGAGDGFRLARKSYNGGCSEDLAAILERLGTIHPESPFAVLGVSLGGNITLRLAGSLGSEAPKRFPQWKALGAMNPPVDLAACCALLENRKNRLYQKQFLRELWDTEIERRKLYPSTLALGSTIPLTLKEYDNRVTAPTWGFSSANEYYSWGSSAPYLEAVEIPGWVLTARDDPFIDPTPLEKMPKGRGPLSVDIAPHGGHLGYLMWKIGPFRWAEPAMIDRLVQLLTKN